MKKMIESPASGETPPDIVWSLREAAKLPKEAVAMAVALNRAADEIERLGAALQEIADDAYGINPRKIARDALHIKRETP